MKHIFTPNAPAPGNYSQGVLAGNTLYLSGQTGNDPETHELEELGVGRETRQALENLLAVVIEAGGDIDSFVSLTVYLKDRSMHYLSDWTTTRHDDWRAYNDAYREFFDEHGRKQLPARAQVWVSEIPLAVESTLVEIAGIAVIPRKTKKQKR